MGRIQCFSTRFLKRITATILKQIEENIYQVTFTIFHLKIRARFFLIFILEEIMLSGMKF